MRISFIKCACVCVCEHVSILSNMMQQRLAYVTDTQLHTMALIIKIIIIVL